MLFITLLLLALLTLDVVFSGVGHRAHEAYQLPPSSLRLVYASQNDISDRLRMGNARRLAVAMRDTDIGLSLEIPLPQPPALIPPTFAPLSAYQATPTPPTRSVVQLLPRLSNTPTPATEKPFQVKLSESLRTAELTPLTQPTKPKGLPAGRVDFWIELNADGRIETLLRVSPSGEETEWQKALRIALNACTGKGAAQGFVTLFWTAETPL